MLKKGYEFIRDNFDKIFLILQLAVAVVLTVITEYLKIEIISENALIITMLIFLTIDMYFILVERLDKVLSKIQLAEKSIDQLVITRNQAPSLESYINSAKSNLFISGSTMSNLMRFESSLVNQLEHNIHIKILLWDVCNSNEINSLIDFDNSSLGELLGQISSSLMFIDRISQIYPNLIEVRFLSTVILTDYVAVDLDGNNAVIKVQNRFYNMSADQYPNYIIKNSDSSFWFDRYHKQINEIWEAATIYDAQYRAGLNELISQQYRRDG